MAIGLQVTDPKFPQRARVTIADGLAKELVDAYNLVGFFHTCDFPSILNVICVIFRSAELLQRSMSTINNVNRTEPMPTTGEPNNIKAPQNFSEKGWIFPELDNFAAESWTLVLHPDSPLHPWVSWQAVQAARGIPHCRIQTRGTAAAVLQCPKKAIIRHFWEFNRPVFCLVKGTVLHCQKQDTLQGHFRESSPLECSTWATTLGLSRVGSKDWRWEKEKTRRENCVTKEQ